MSSPNRYDPPEAVLAPAFKELLERLRRGRQFGVGDTEITEEERKVVEYGVTERKRVLEHTLFLVFGQWAVYRQFISGLKSRGLRIGYGTASAVATVYFMRNRAMRVSHEMFSNMATMSTTSPLGNEARVILAELEGPSGPYFRRICSEKGFSEDLESVISSLDAEDDVDPTSDNLHPQLRLRPRLLPADTAHQASIVRGRDAKDKRERGDVRGTRQKHGLADGLAQDAQYRPAIYQRDGGAYRRDNDKAAAYDMGDSDSTDPWGPGRFEEASRKKRAGRTGEWERKRNAEQERELPEDDAFGKPFDFSTSARQSWYDETSEAASEFGIDGAADESPDTAEAAMTAGQRRAAERRKRRLKSQRMRGGNGGDGS